MGELFQEKLYKNIPVMYNGEIAFYLNSRLIAKQGLSDEEVEEIKLLHQERLQLEAVMQQTTEKHLKSLYAAWLDIQRELQAAWKFELDDNFIKFWEVPRCTCPKMDNNDNYPFGYYVINCDCPVHGE